MTRYLLRRPIAVILTTLCLLVFGVLAWTWLPVSLLPDAEVPRMLIKVRLPDASPQTIEQQVLAPIREGMLTLPGLDDIHSQASNESGVVSLSFSYETNMDLAYLEANEKIDRLTDRLPDMIARPQVVRISASDIPIMRVHAVPRQETDLLGVSLLAENVLRKRLEQSAGISLVDVNGLTEPEVQITLIMEKLSALQLNEQRVISAIRQSNRDLGAVTVRDGPYQYHLRLQSQIVDAESIARLPVPLPESGFVTLGQIAEVQTATRQPSGVHLLNGQQGVVMTVHKQTGTQMNETLASLQKVIASFRTDYPNIEFFVSRDQSRLLSAGISNLSTSLLFGGLFAFVILFVFMGNVRIPLIMGVSLPVSLVISFLLMYALDISLNIVSISGLALGIGMLIDNSIIVLDNIHRNRSEGEPIDEACVKGVEEVRAAMISSVLTTLAVFVPLIFLGEVAGALFFDQAVAVAIILIVSLAVAFVLLPLLYKLLVNTAGLEHSKLFRKILALYERGYKSINSNRPVWAAIFLTGMSAGVALAYILPQKGLPDITETDFIAELEWADPIGLHENVARCRQILREGGNDVLIAADVGITQFLFSPDRQTIQFSEMYFHYPDANSRESGLRKMESVLAGYSNLRYHLRSVENPLEQLISTYEPYYEVRWKPADRSDLPDVQRTNDLLASLPVLARPGPGLETQPATILGIDHTTATRYRVNTEAVITAIHQAFGSDPVTRIDQSNSVIPVTLTQGDADFELRMQKAEVQNGGGVRYPLRRFVNVERDVRYKHITSDRSGPYHSLVFETAPSDGELSSLNEWALNQNLKLDFAGMYFTERRNITRLLFILAISATLLFFILAAQYESYKQPLVVILTFPAGVAGSVILLLILGQSLNLMSAIGMVVMLGIIVNDSILKVETINRKYRIEGKMLDEALAESGAIRLKPILMTTLTTILALLPVTFFGGIGAELQAPLAISVIGGLITGTLASLFFIPVAYRWFSL